LWDTHTISVIRLLCGSHFEYALQYISILMHNIGHGVDDTV